MKKSLVFSLLGVIFAVVIFFLPFILSNKLVVPADTLIGLYHPFRDLYASDYPRGVPFKNSLITDPVRQQIPWRELVISLEKDFTLPLWNPYQMAGYPLLATMQSASFYPLNFLFFILSFVTTWNLLVFLQPLLAGVFLFFYLRNRKLSYIASAFGGITFAFSGFQIAWLEWNTIGHVVLWLPLILLAKDKLIEKFTFRWAMTLIFAEVSAIFAGHLQILFYLLLLSNAYLFVRIYEVSKGTNFKQRLLIGWGKYKPFLLTGIIVFIIGSIQLLPTFQFISLSAREIDIRDWQIGGWFIPWQHLVQFIAPDFFGNPATGNYWGVWNYGEFIGYIGLFPLLMAFVALIYSRRKETFFFGATLIVALLFALPTIIAKLPFLINIPLLATSQPTRLLFLIDFSLAILSAVGLDYYMKNNKRILLPLSLMVTVFVGLWSFLLLVDNNIVNIQIARRNLILPTSLLILIATVTFITLKNRTQLVFYTLLGIILMISYIDLLRFGNKFIPFTDSAYFFPSTRTISFLQKNSANHRIMSIDQRILPPNFHTFYKLQSIEGYDPLYMRRFGEFMAALSRNKADISSPLGFNRIVTTSQFDSRLIDLLGVKYVLSLSDVDSSKLKKVYQEGETRVYENINVFPRAFFVNTVRLASSKKEAISFLFDKNIDLHSVAVVENDSRVPFPLQKSDTIGSAHILSYTQNLVIIETLSQESNFLVLTDTYYPTWKARIRNAVTNEIQNTPIYMTNYNFRGIVVPRGKHIVEFYNNLY